MLRAAVFGLVAACVLSQCINDCSNHGDCESGRCHCEEGFGGDDCNTYLCAEHTEGCSGHGQCRNNTCVCHSGFGGFNCAALTTNCPDHCKGHGSCLDGVCTCDRGFTGTDCGLVDGSALCTNNCSGHGFCDTSLAEPSCICTPSYWTGEACDTELSQCPPTLNNCTGHGICGPLDAVDPQSEWVCSCEIGFCGAACSQACPVCANNCTGHGVCKGTECHCFPGFAGADCSRVAAIDACANNCSGHGRCRQVNGQFQCVCEEGYTGESCVLANPTCPDNCSGKGECMPDGKCICISGFNGVSCAIALGNCFASNNCSANGLCVDGVCKCFPGFGGADCSLACHTGGIGDVGCNADKLHGVCINGSCVCKEGEWEGVGCELPANPTTISAVVSTSNPIGVIVLSIVCAAAFLLLFGFVFNYTTKGKRGLNAVPGMDALRSSMKGDDFEATAENRYASNY